MRQLLSLILGLAVFAASAVAVTLLYQQVAFNYWISLILLGLSAWGAGYLAARNARDAFSGMLGGVIATAALWFADDHSTAWAATIFHAPLHSLNSDEVLLGMSLSLMAFLVGARSGEQAGLRAWHTRVQVEGGVRRHAGSPPGGTFTLPAPPPPEASGDADVEHYSEGSN